MIIKPLAVGLKVCEKAVVDSGTVTLVNCLRRLIVKSGFPARIPILFAFVSVADGLGSCQMEVVVHRLETMDEIISEKWRTDFSESLRERWFRVPLGPL